MSLLIAVAKGRIIEEILPLLAQTPFALDEEAMKSRALRIPTATAGVEVILLKSADLPRYVADGIAALGVVGSDTLDERDAELLELADLRLGACRLSLCAEAGVDLEGLRRKHGHEVFTVHGHLAAGRTAHSGTRSVAEQRGTGPGPGPSRRHR